MLNDIIHHSCVAFSGSECSTKLYTSDHFLDDDRKRNILVGSIILPKGGQLDSNTETIKLSKFCAKLNTSNL